jgi:hypothetical protein
MQVVFACKGSEESLDRPAISRSHHLISMWRSHAPMLGSSPRSSRCKHTCQSFACPSRYSHTYISIPSALHAQDNYTVKSWSDKIKEDIWPEAICYATILGKNKMKYIYIDKDEGHNMFEINLHCCSVPAMIYSKYLIQYYQSITYTYYCVKCTCIQAFACTN